MGTCKFETYDLKYGKSFSHYKRVNCYTIIQMVVIAHKTK